jgi:hypothetical protein
MVVPSLCLNRTIALVERDLSSADHALTYWVPA